MYSTNLNLSLVDLAYLRSLVVGRISTLERAKDGNKQKDGDAAELRSLAGVRADVIAAEARILAGITGASSKAPAPSVAPLKPAGRAKPPAQQSLAA